MRKQERADNAAETDAAGAPPSDSLQAAETGENGLRLHMIREAMPSGRAIDSETETPAHLLSDGLEMPAAGGSYLRQPDGTLTLNTADEAIAARKDDDA